jgi:hypothetical protein
MLVLAEATSLQPQQEVEPTTQEEKVGAVLTLQEYRDFLLVVVVVETTSQHFQAATQFMAVVVAAQLQGEPEVLLNLGELAVQACLALAEQLHQGQLLGAAVVAQLQGVAAELTHIACWLFLM